MKINTTLPLSLTILLLAFPLLPSTTDAAESHSACHPNTQPEASVYRFNADLDGIDGPELFIADRTTEQTIITACYLDSLGPWNMGDTNKPLNTVVVVDIEGDGKDELIIGGPTGSAPLNGSVVRLAGTELERGEPVSIRPADEVFEGRTFRCIDTNNDGLRDVINYTYKTESDGSALHWKSSDNNEGTFLLPQQSTEAWLFKSGQCADRLIANLEFKIGGYSSSVILNTAKSHLIEGKSVPFGINNTISFKKTSKQLQDATNWIIQKDYYAGFEGPFPILDYLETATKITTGPHNHCIAQPLTPPDLPENNLTQVSFQPRYTSSCLQWFAVDFWMRPDFTIAAVMLNLWEP